MEVLSFVDDDGVEALVGQAIERLEKERRRLFAPERLRVRADGCRRPWEPRGRGQRVAQRMERGHRKAVRARFQVGGQAAVVTEQQDPAALRRQAPCAFHRDQRLPGACSTGDAHSRKGAQDFKDVELLLREPYESGAVFRESGGERGRQHHPRCEQLHELRHRGGREWTAVADRRFEHAVDRLVSPLQTAAVDDEHGWSFNGAGPSGVRST